jgi:dolichyl-phosphate mannosyltransferase polypeptide 3
MSKGTRFLTLAIPAVVLYVLLLADIFPAPFVSKEIADQILPVVS